jgi:hypothetical protein
MVSETDAIDYFIYSCFLKHIIIYWQFFGFLFFGFFFSVLEFELSSSCLLGRHSITWATLPTLFCVGYFPDGSRTVCLGWLQITILLISASWVARIRGINQQCPACFCSWMSIFWFWCTEVVDEVQYFLFRILWYILS